MQIQSLSTASLQPLVQPSATRSDSLVLARKTPPQNTSGVLGDTTSLSDLKQDKSRPVIHAGLIGLGTGAALGAGMGYLLPTVKVGSGIAISAAFGAGAGAAAGAGAGYVVNRWLDGKVSSTAAGAGVGLVAGAASGALMGVAMGGHKLMNAGFMAIPGAIAGAVSGFAAARMKAE